MAPLLALLRRPLPTVPLAIFVGWWVAMVSWALRRGYSDGWLVVSLAGLVAGTRLLVLWMWPFDRIDGDMLATIGRALEALAAGRFPYADYPPPMPYLPGTFLAYAPSKAMGLDLRYTNLALDVIAAFATVRLARLAAVRGRPAAPSSGDATPLVGQLLLPCLMLHPVWVHYSVNSHFSPCVLFSTLLGLSVLLGNPTVQAMALGVAVGSNQMLGACGPILFAHWAGRDGLKRAAGLALVAAAVFLLIVAPFLIWEPRRFVEIAFLGRAGLGDQLMAGRLTLLPLASRFLPQASLIGSSIALGVASWAAYASRRPAVAVTAMATGLCAALLFQPVSFTHYFLPVLALASVVPVADPYGHGRPRIGVGSPFSRGRAASGPGGRVDLQPRDHPLAPADVAQGADPAGRPAHGREG